MRRASRTRVSAMRRFERARRELLWRMRCRARANSNCVRKETERPTDSSSRDTCTRKIYNWFSEGFDTADLKDAKALLEELSNEMA